MSRTIILFFKYTHQWLGLIGGWFLFLIFVSGTLSLFDIEITQWMEPELVTISPASLSEKSLIQAYKFWTYNQNSPKNLISLPSTRDPYLRILHIENKLIKDNALDPTQGTVIPVRATAGGAFIDSIHKSLYIDRYWGGLILLTISILFMISTLTGLLLYLKIFLKTVFNLYPKASPLRILLNYHTTLGFLFIPFLFITAISGSLFLFPRYLFPSPQQTHNIYPKKIKPFSLTDQQDLFSLVKQTENYFQHPAGMIFITPKEIKITEAESYHLPLLKNYLAFDPKTGQMIPHKSNLTVLNQIQSTLSGIHKNRSGGLSMRILSFLAGSISTLCLACGLFYYSNRHKNMKCTSISSYIFHKFIEGLNTGIIMGTLIGFITYFWLNRLIPVNQPERISYETNIFFLIILVTCIYGILMAFLKNTGKALTKLLFILGNLCLLLPVIDCLTNTVLFKTALFNQNFIFVKLDVIAFFLGLCFLQLYRFLQEKGYLS